jgi:HK97 family phage major capsid protein
MARAGRGEQQLTAGSFLVGDFAQVAVRDREQARVEVSREHSDFFTRNLVAILAEERIALTVFKPTAFVKGTFA